MFIREISIEAFETFANQNKFSTFHQTINYALLKSENDYEYEIIGYGDDKEIYAAALVLVKLIDGYLYAYIPEGFLIDFTNEKLVHNFTNALVKYYKKESINFIKINPAIPIAEIDYKTGNKETIAENYKISNLLISCGFNKLDETKAFESVLPKYNAIIETNNINLNNYSKNTKNKIRKAARKGLTFEKSTVYELEILYSFIKRKIKRSEYYYNDYYNIFERNNSIDFFLVGIDYEKFTINTQNLYNLELRRNHLLNVALQTKNTTKNINKKISSDRNLLSYKNDISIAANKMSMKSKDYIAGALVIRHKDTATILINGFDKKYSSFAPNYYLFYNLLEYYKDKVKYINLNGITGEFKENTKYHGLDRFKLSFKPRIYEYIGEFDLVINNSVYNKLMKKGLLAKEFNN